MRTRLALLFITLTGLVASVSAATYASAYSGFTALGPNGVMVDIGFPIEFIYFYNYISLGFIFLLATSASQKNSSFFALLIPLFAAMFAWWGWLVVPTGSQLWGIVICMGVLAVALYMKTTQQEKFGIAGPGSPFLNIVFWMIVIQASIGFINASGLFSLNVAATPDTFQNVALLGNVPTIVSVGGWFSQITAPLYLLGTYAISALLMLWNVLISIVWFKALVISIAPFLSEFPLVDHLLTLLSGAIDFIIIVAIWIWLTKPVAGESV